MIPADLRRQLEELPWKWAPFWVQRDADGHFETVKVIRVADLDAVCRAWQAEQGAEQNALRDANLRADNAEISYQQTVQQMHKAGELLEALTFWPSPTADQNVARDIGRVLLGKPSERSSGIEEALAVPSTMTRSWKQRAEQAEQGWRDIASAPKDGSTVIGFDPRRVDINLDGAEFMRWMDGSWLDPATHTMKPTHWMPLPDPPVAAPAATEEP